MNARRLLALFLVVDVVCAAVCLAVLTVGDSPTQRIRYRSPRSSQA